VEDTNDRILAEQTRPQWSRATRRPRARDSCNEARARDEHDRVGSVDHAGRAAALRAHRLRQLERDIVPAGYIFTTEIGTPVSASNYMRRHFYPIAARAGIPTRRQPDGSQGLRLHDLRHGCGTLLISLGVKPKLVQTILRHSRLATTMDLYVHAYDEDLREAVRTLDRALGS
jgi:integrase